MQFLLLIYSNEATDPKPGTDEFGPFMQGYQDFTTKVREEGKLVSADALQPVVTASTLTVRDGKTTITDGPFAETKEQLGGYYLLECENFDEAAKYAAMIPTASYGRVEIRPIVVWDS